MEKIYVYPNQKLNRIEPALFGHFVENAPGNIHSGIFQEGHPLSDVNGFRTDVLEAVKRVKPTQIRWGGNFSSCYNWMDGVGPKEQRPRRFNFAWNCEEDNHFGTAEFIELCRQLDATPMICANMGSGTALEAMNWIEYCNGTGSTYYADLRRQHGFEEPFNVHYWSLGNEMYGGWQFGNLTVDQYIEKAIHFATAMKKVDPTIHLTACGLETDPIWNMKVARALAKEDTFISPGNCLNAISLHYYPIGCHSAFTNAGYEQRMSMGQFFHERTMAMRSAIVAGTDDPLSPIEIAWDEWNLVGQPDGTEHSMENILWSSLVLNSFIRDSAYVKRANYTFFVNWFGPIQTSDEGIRLEAEMMLFEMYQGAIGDSLISLRQEGETIQVEMPLDDKRLQQQIVREKTTALREIHYIDAVASGKNDENIFSLFLTNLHKDEDTQVQISIMEAAEFSDATLISFSSNNLSARGYPGISDDVFLKTCDVSISNNTLTVTLPKHSVSVIKCFRK